MRHQGNLLDAAENANRRRLKAGRTTARDGAPASRFQMDIDKVEDAEAHRQCARIHQIVAQEHKDARNMVATNAGASLVVRASIDEVEDTHDMDTSYDDSYDEPSMFITMPTAATARVPSGSSSATATSVSRTTTAGYRIN